MRFITEFKIEDYHAKDNFASKTISGRQNMLQSDIGDMLADSFGWQNPVNGNDLHYRLEIEAFPMDKWMLFKTKLFHRLLQDNIPTKYFSHLIEELESFGKPSGDYNVPDNPPTALTGVKTYFDSKDGKVYRQTPDGEVEDITTDKPSGDAITNQQLNNEINKDKK